MIHPNDLAEIQTVKAQWQLPMNPSCRTRRRPNKTQTSGKIWVLRGEITTNLLNDETSMDSDGDEDAKVQYTKSQLEAALGAKFKF